MFAIEYNLFGWIKINLIFFKKKDWFVIEIIFIVIMNEMIDMELEELLLFVLKKKLKKRI